jgi:dihydrolipoamide dehydrogenase
VSSTQLVVIGGGPGGYAAAFFAADMGLQVTLVDMELNPGGVCLFRGCIPSKALLHVAKVASEAKHAANWGLTYAEPAIDLDKLRGFKNGVVSKLTGGLGQLSKQRKITYIQGTATFVDA